jgi:hypothetical protein
MTVCSFAVRTLHEERRRRAGTRTNRITAGDRGRYLLDRMGSPCSRNDRRTVGRRKPVDGTSASIGMLDLVFIGATSTGGFTTAGEIEAALGARLGAKSTHSSANGPTASGAFDPPKQPGPDEDPPEERKRGEAGLCRGRPDANKQTYRYETGRRKEQTGARTHWGCDKRSRQDGLT